MKKIIPTLSVLAVALGLGVLGVMSPTSAATAPGRAVDIEYTPDELGYYVLDNFGRVSTHGDATYYGGAPPPEAGESAVSISPTPSGNGYWIFTDRGRVVTYGDAPFLGDVSHLSLAGPVLDSVPTPTGMGYYMLGDDGGIFAFGDAEFHGSIPEALPGVTLDGKIVGLAPTPTGLGYWLVAEDGGMFSFGDAEFFGSLPGILPAGTILAEPVTGMVPQGNGYLMVARDGGIFSFGQSNFHGSIPGLDITLGDEAEVVAVMVRSDRSGYVMIGRDGGPWPFGEVTTHGSVDVAIPDSPGNVRNCPDFSTQIEAQRWFDTYRPFYGDVAGLDTNDDGIPCESLEGAGAAEAPTTDTTETEPVCVDELWEFEPDGSEKLLRSEQRPCGDQAPAWRGTTNCASGRDDTTPGVFAFVRCWVNYPPCLAQYRLYEWIYNPFDPTENPLLSDETHPCDEPPSWVATYEGQCREIPTAQGRPPTACWVNDELASAQATTTTEPVTTATATTTTTESVTTEPVTAATTTTEPVTMSTITLPTPPGICWLGDDLGGSGHYSTEEACPPSWSYHDGLATCGELIAEFAATGQWAAMCGERPTTTQPPAPPMGWCWEAATFGLDLGESTTQEGCSEFFRRGLWRSGPKPTCEQLATEGHLGYWAWDCPETWE